MAVLQGRQRLEDTLSSSALADKDSVFRLVSSQFAAAAASSSPSCSSGSSPSSPSMRAEAGAAIGAGSNQIVQNLFAQVWELLELLRSASGEVNHDLTITKEEDTALEGWKLKHHTGQLRVMYREGPKGTPFHTLLAEGVVYSSITSALCVAWEVPSYYLWWPQMIIPPFKVIETRWIKRGFNGEDLSLVRVKVPWPLAAREVVMCAFELEVLDEELIIVLLHSFPDTEEFSWGSKPPEIPDASPDIVRMELNGGFVLQKISEEQSYFRTVANLDIKLDLVPPWLINFISRQLVGLGFKLYQNTLHSINREEGNSDHFQKLIDTEPMYKRLRKGLESKKANGYAKENSLGNHIPSERQSEIEEVESSKGGEKAEGKSDAISSNEGQRLLVLATDDEPGSSSLPTSGTGGTVDPEVQKALNVLDHMISLVQSRKIGGSPIGNVSIPFKSGTTISPHTQSVCTQCHEMDGPSQNKLAAAMASPPRLVLPKDEEPSPSPESLKVKTQSKWFCLNSSHTCCGYK